MMRKLLYISALVFLAVLTGCADRERVSARLDALDSLLSLPPTGPEPPVNYGLILTQLDTLLPDVVGDDALEAHWNLLCATAEDKAVVAAAKKLFAAAKVTPKTITGGTIGKVLKVLGYLPEAKAAAEKFAAFLKAEGVKTLVVSNPAAFDALTKDYPEFGVKLPCKVFCFSGVLNQSKAKFTKKAGELYYLADDFMRNYDGCECPEKLLKTLKAELRPFGTNDEESYCCGEGAIVLDKLNPQLVKALAEYVAARADDPKKDKIVVLSAYTKKCLAKYGKLNVVTMEEVAASCL